MIIEMKVLKINWKSLIVFMVRPVITSETCIHVYNKQFYAGSGCMKIELDQLLIFL